MTLRNVTNLDVYHNDALVGHLHQEDDGLVSFEYAPSWLKNGFSISPFSLPLKEGKFFPKNDDFQGLFGVFADSLPGIWGKKLINHYLLKNGIDPRNITPLTRLSFLSGNAIGSLSYKPSKMEFPKLDEVMDASKMDFDEVKEVIALFNDNEVDKRFGGLLYLSSSVKGDKPKCHIHLNDEEWIIKYSGKGNVITEGQMEYEFARCAEECDIDLPMHLLLNSRTTQGFYAARRFDRKNEKKIHVISLSALLEVPAESHAIDYLTFMQAAYKLTKDENVLYEILRRASFNVFAHVYDDGGDNHSFIYDEDSKRYALAPAYDLMTTAYRKEHEISVNWNGNPTKDDLMELAMKMGLPYHESKDIIEHAEYTVNKRLKVFIKDN